MKITRTNTKSGQYRPVVHSDSSIYSVSASIKSTVGWVELHYSTYTGEMFEIQFTQDDSLDILINALTDLKNGAA